MIKDEAAIRGIIQCSGEMSLVEICDKFGLSIYAARKLRRKLVVARKLAEMDRQSLEYYMQLPDSVVQKIWSDYSDKEE